MSLKRALLDLTSEFRQPEDMNSLQLLAHLHQQREAGQDTRLWEVYLHRKAAVPFASLLFALIGAPLGVRGERGGASRGLGFSVLVIFAYYLVMFLGMAGGQTGWISPMLGAWLPNLAGGAIAGWLIVQADWAR